jgi:hypothetical protein
MARIARVSLSPKFQQMDETSYRLFNEFNDCGVKAVALVCNVSYGEAHAKLRELGRQSRKGTPWSMIRQAINFFGYEIKVWDFTDHRALINSYPGRAVYLQQITTHHPRRYPKVWAEKMKGKRLLLGVHKHVAAYVDGELHDWTVNSVKRVWLVWEITKKGI